MGLSRPSGFAFHDTELKPMRDNEGRKRTPPPKLSMSTISGWGLGRTVPCLVVGKRLLS